MFLIIGKHCREFAGKRTARGKLPTSGNDKAPMPGIRPRTCDKNAKHCGNTLRVVDQRLPMVGTRLTTYTDRAQAHDCLS
ncbi:hypothetical protein LJC16_03285 [Bacteroidales bacterium OttesenSCG-928-C19]|nr:hypothetical protein [Bacteroidales bacterium OttesenSCG-928-C19]